MTYQRLFEVSTRETIAGNRRIAQVIAIPTGRLDKVSIFLEGEIDPALTGEETSVVVELYAVTQQNLPTGPALASDRKTVLDVFRPSFYNFALPADAPTTAAILVRMEGDARNKVFWSYISTTTEGEPMAVDADGTGQWQQDTSRKMSYIAFSLVEGAVVLDDERSNFGDEDNTDADIAPDIDVDIIQSALIQPGTPETLLSDTRDDFSAMTLDRTVAIGDTIAIEFGDYVIALVVDQSGSMTWNDRQGLRFDFLESFIDDITDNLAASNIAARYFIGVSMRSEDTSWTSVDQWNDGFIELSPGVEYDALMTVNGTEVELRVFEGAMLKGLFSTTMPENPSASGLLNEFILGRDSGDLDDDSFLSATFAEVRADSIAPDDVLFDDDLSSDAGWEFSDPAGAVFSGGDLALTAQSGTNQIGTRPLISSAGDNFSVSTKFTIDAAANWYDLLAGLASGRNTGNAEKPGGVWMRIGFEKANISTAKFSVLKFRGRKVARLRLLLDEDAGGLLQKVVILRNGVQIHESLNEQFIDRGDEGVPLVPGVSYLYSIFSVDNAGNKSETKTVAAAPSASTSFPLGVAGFLAQEEIIKDGDIDVGKRRVKLTWTIPESDDPTEIPDRLTIVRRDDRSPESELDGDVILVASAGTPEFDPPFFDFNLPGFDESTYPAAGLTYHYRIFTERAGLKTPLVNARASSVTISESDKPWEDGLVSIPPTYDPTPPGAPSGVAVEAGARESRITWDAVATARRYEIYVGEFEHPTRGIDPQTGRIVYTTRDAVEGQPQQIQATFNGSATEFIHRDLENFEPYFYIVVAYDAVNNASEGTEAFGRPDKDAEDTIPPEAPLEFSADPNNATSIVLRWTLPLPDSDLVEAFFSDRVTAIAVVTFEDDDVQGDTSVLEVSEVSRETTGLNVDDLPEAAVSDAIGAEEFGTYQDAVGLQPETDDTPASSSEITATLDEAAKSRTDETETLAPEEETDPDVILAQEGAVAIDSQGNIQVNPLVVIETSTGSASTGDTSLSVAMTQNLTLLNLLEEAEVIIDAGLFVRNASTGEDIASVFGGEGTIRFRNPLEIIVQDDPASKITRRTKWNEECCCEITADCGIASGSDMCLAEDGQGIGWTCQELTGSFAIIGDGIPLTIEARWRGDPVGEPLPVTLRLLDAQTGQLSTNARIPGSNADGILSLTAEAQSRDILDRANEPSGFTETKTLAEIVVPPQQTPGDYLVEIIAEFRGYVRKVLFPIHYEHPLNVDVIPSPFIPNGVDIAEQMALVYLGDPTAPNNEKIPVEDGVLVNWSIIPGDKFTKTRPFFSRSDLPGTGIKSTTLGGMSREIFFGPGVDIESFECEQNNPCHPYEWYFLEAEVEHLGVKKTGRNIIRANPFVDASDEQGLNRIFLRPVIDGSPGFSTDSISSDGAQESTWEVLAVPREDGLISDTSKGAFFHQQITSLGGLVPDLPEGTVVSLRIDAFFGDPEFDITPSDEQRNLSFLAGKMEVKTDLTGGDFIQTDLARATIVGGKAEFKLRMNALAIGTPLEAPLETESENIIYGTRLTWPSAPLVFSLTASASLPVRGKTIAFFGGGRNLRTSTPSCFLSLEEPLGTVGESTTFPEEETGSQGP
jgi:hypothetical protein